MFTAALPTSVKPTESITKMMNFPNFQKPNPSMTDADIKYWLRKLDFPNCAREALNTIANLCSMPGPPARLQIQLQTDLMEEFVFGEFAKLKQQKKPVALQELQLIEVMSTFFNAPDRQPAVRNAVFLFLYPAESTRFKILGNLVSLSIATQNKEVLDSTGMWMQQLGSTSAQSVDLAKHVLDDYFVYTPNSIEKLKQLPTLVPHFTANLLTAIGEVYKDKDPPNELLELAGDWIDENPSLLLTSLMDNPALPSGGIPMTPITPIAGLFRWCILSPARCDVDKIQQSVATEKSNKLYSKIQQLLMDSVLRLTNNASNKHAISAQHLADTTRTLINVLQTSTTNSDKTLRDLAMERLAQAVSTAMSANCIYGNKQELLALLQPLAFRHFLIEWTLQTYASKTS